MLDAGASCGGGFRLHPADAHDAGTSCGGVLKLDPAAYDAGGFVVEIQNWTRSMLMPPALGLSCSLQLIPILENQMEKNLENEMETGAIKWLHMGLSPLKSLCSE